MNESGSKKVIAIDLGGTKIHAAIIEEDKNIIAEKKIATDKKNSPNSIVNSLYDLIHEMLSYSDVDKIGIASAGRINSVEGKVFFATDNLPGWTGVNLKDLIEKEFNIDTVVENDVNAAGLGEQWNGNAKNYNSTVCLTLGTGIAASIIINRELMRGSHWSAGEVGHMIIHPDGILCNCGLKGCFEQYCSGTALVKKYNIISEKKIMTGEEFFKLVDLKDINAINILDEFTSDLALSIINLSNIIDPDAFIIGGGLINTRDYWWDDFISKVNNSSLAEIFMPIILPSKLDNYSGLFGAAYLALNNV